MNNDKTFTYLSVDVETTGNHPHKNSLLALAVIAYNAVGEIIGDYHSNILMRPETNYSPSTLDFWNNNKEAHNAVQLNPVNPLKVMSNFYEWLKNFGQYTFIGYNVAYDVNFLSYYVDWAFADDTNRKINLIPIELRSFMLGRLNLTWKETAKSNWNNLPFAHLLLEESNLAKNLHHTPLYDAELQGKVFWWLMNYNHA